MVLCKSRGKKYGQKTKLRWLIVQHKSDRFFRVDRGILEALAWSPCEKAWESSGCAGQVAGWNADHWFSSMVVNWSLHHCFLVPFCKLGRTGPCLFLDPKLVNRLDLGGLYWNYLNNYQYVWLTLGVRVHLAGKTRWFVKKDWWATILFYVNLNTRCFTCFLKLQFPEVRNMQSPTIQSSQEQSYWASWLALERNWAKTLRLPKSQHLWLRF